MTAPLGLVIADDATGALETGAAIAERGLEVRVGFGTAFSEPSPEILVVDTESRHVSVDEARRRVRDLACYARTSGVVHIYKKIDSTLRGHIGPEILELQAAFPERPVELIAAYPALGRLVRGGRMYVHGELVHTTEFASDARNPVQTSDIGALLSSTDGIRIHDAASEEDLADILKRLKGDYALRIIAGSAGFVAHWMEYAGFPVRPPHALPRIGSWLLVCGSRHPVSRRQAARLCSAGIPTLYPAAESGLAPEAVAARLGKQAADWIWRDRPEGVMIFGGDTARALWRALGIEELHPMRALASGAALSVASLALPMFVTKAGGFGGDDLGLEIVEKLT